MRSLRRSAAMPLLVEQRKGTNRTFDDVYGANTSPYYSIPSRRLIDYCTRRDLTSSLVLDFGSGDGRHAVPLARISSRVVAIDSSVEAIVKLEQRCIDLRIANVDAVCANGVEVNFPENTFGALVASTVLDHLQSDDLPLVVANLRAALKPGGFAYVSVFTTADPAYGDDPSKLSETSDLIARFFSPGELSTLFSDWDVVHYGESTFRSFAHGPPHMHSMAELIAHNPG